MTEDAVWDTEKGELRILGQRHVAVDIQVLCDYLDSLVGDQVAEVIMHSLEFRLGKLEAAKIRTEMPRAALSELVEHLAKTERLTGMGIVKVNLPENPQNPIEIELSNSSIKGTSGSAKAFVFAWWAGALTALLDKEMDVKNIVYNEQKNLMRCQIVPR